jgi:creatinine amidohydrolase
MPTLAEFITAHQAQLREGTPVYLPVNPIEYHGPHLSLLNDHLISIGLAADLQQRLGRGPLLVAPDLDVGFDPTPGPGTIVTSFPEVKARVLAACTQLADAGAQRVVLMTFHGSPLHALAIEAGVELLRSRGVKALSPLNLLLQQLLSFDAGGDDALKKAFETIPDPVARERAWRGLPTDFHGGFFETSVVMHYAPDSVRPNFRAMPPCPDYKATGIYAFAASVARAIGFTTRAQELELAGAGMAWFALRPFPGYTGQPALASPAAGAAFARAIIDRYAVAAEAVLYGDARSPRPILAWLAYLPFTAGNPPVPPDAIWQPTP